MAATPEELDALREELRGDGIPNNRIESLISTIELNNANVDDPGIQQAIAALRAAGAIEQQQASEQQQEDIQSDRVKAAGSPEMLAFLDRAFEMSLVGDENIANLARTFGPTVEQFGFTQDAIDVVRSAVGLGPSTSIGEQFFPLGNPDDAANLEEIRNAFGGSADDLTVVVDPTGNDADKEALASLGLLYRGLNANGDIIAAATNGKEFIYGRNDDGSLFRIGTAGSSGVGGGGGAARVNLQNIGVDKDGFALVFNPSTGSITKGPQVGFAQIDPRTIAAEEARQFNEAQGLKEGEFLRDVLSNGRNFLTAAFLSRGQAGGSPLANTTQIDLLSRGFGPQQSLGGLNQALGFLSPEDRAKVPGFVVDGLTAQGALDSGGITFGAVQPGAQPTSTGGIRPGEVDPNTLARPPGARFGQTSSFAIGDKPAAGTGGGTGTDARTLGEMALAFAPPAVKDIAAGKEVGGLSTSGTSTTFGLANPQTLMNLTKDERGALDTTLQNVDQRTLAEFEQESNQRFRGQGSRLATRN
jgi:hypothetical protein